MKTRRVSKTKSQNLQWRMKNVYYPTLHDSGDKQKQEKILPQYVRGVHESKKFFKSSAKVNDQDPSISTMNQDTFKSYLKNFYTTNPMLFKNNTKSCLKQHGDERTKNELENIGKKSDNSCFLNLGEFIRQKVKTIIDNYQTLHKFSPRARRLSINDDSEIQLESDKYKTSKSPDRTYAPPSDSTLFHGHDVSMVTIVSSDLYLKNNENESSDLVTPKYEKQQNISTAPEESNTISNTKVTSAKILNKDDNYNTIKNTKRTKIKQNRSGIKDKENRPQKKIMTSTEMTKGNVKGRKRAGGTGRGDNIRPVTNVFVNEKNFDTNKMKTPLERNSSQVKKHSSNDPKNFVGNRNGLGLKTKVKEKWSTEVLDVNKKESTVIFSETSSRKYNRQRKLKSKTPKYYGTMTRDIIWTGSSKLRGCVVLEDAVSCSGFLVLGSNEKKKMARPTEYNIYFILHRGQAAVNINDINYVPKILDHLFVPIGAKYSIKNLSHDQALFSYVKIKSQVTSS